MIFDGICLRKIVAELRTALIGGKLNKSADAIRKTRGRAKDKAIKKFNKIKEEDNNDF